jgi:prepilin-type N-terminal cleavage/methylation domain-containing protein
MKKVLPMNTRSKITRSKTIFLAPMLVDNRGFSVMEFLIALMLAGIVTSGAFAIYNTQQKQWNVQNQVTDMQSGIRAAAEELTTKIRMAGYRVPDIIPPILGSNTNPDTIIVTYNSDDISGVQIEHAMPQSAADLLCDGHDLTGLNNGDLAYIYDAGAGTGEYFEATQVRYATSVIRHASPLNRAYPLGSKIMKLNRYKYYIDQSNIDHPNMMVRFGNNAAQIYAENITNLNVKYILANGNDLDAPTTPALVREIRFTITGRTDKVDNEFQTPYRARTIDTRVKIRNLGLN